MGCATDCTICSLKHMGGGLRLPGGLELKRTGLGEAAKQAPGSTRGLEPAGAPTPHRSRTSSSLEALLWWSLQRSGSVDIRFLLSPQLIRSSSSSEECRSRLVSKRRRRRRNRTGEIGLWLCCWLVAKGVRAQFRLLSRVVHKQEFRQKIYNNVEMQRTHTSVNLCKLLVFSLGVITLSLSAAVVRNLQQSAHVMLKYDIKYFNLTLDPHHTLNLSPLWCTIKPQQEDLWCAHQLHRFVHVPWKATLFS